MIMFIVFSLLDIFKSQKTSPNNPNLCSEYMKIYVYSNSENVTRLASVPFPLTLPASEASQACPCKFNNDHLAQHSSALHIHPNFEKVSCISSHQKVVGVSTLKVNFSSNLLSATERIKNRF